MVAVRRAREDVMVDRKTLEAAGREKARAQENESPIPREPDPPFYDEAPPQRPGDGDGDSGQPQQPAGDDAPRGR